MATTTQTALTKVIARLNSELGSGLPTPLITVYSRHKVANLLLDAITVEPESNIPNVDDGAFGDSQFIDNHEITLSVRIHTSYMGGVEDLAGTLDLLDQALTAINTPKNLGDRYMFMGFGAELINVEFGDSHTVGAEFKITVHKVERY